MNSVRFILHKKFSLNCFIFILFFITGCNEKESSFSSQGLTNSISTNSSSSTDPLTNSNNGPSPSSTTNTGTGTVSDTIAPTAPTQLSASNIQQTSFTLSWAPSTDTGGSSLAGYKILKNGMTTTSSLQTALSYNATGLAAATQYSYVVQAVDGAGNTTNSSNFVITTLPAPQPTQTSPGTNTNTSVGPQADGGYSSAPTNPFGRIDYFVDSVAGSNSNNGTSQSTPFQTLSKVTGLNSTVTLQPGDRVFLKRGSVFRETMSVIRSGNSTKPITFSAYGTGAAPIITGADLVTPNWTVHSGNIYKTSVPAAVGRALLFNEAIQTEARFPNKDASVKYLYKDALTPNHASEASGLYYITDADIPAHPSGGSWAGASLTLRETNWSYLPTKVTNWEPSLKRLTIDLHGYGFTGGLNTEWKKYKWGYFFFGALAFIDQPGEWYFDAATNFLYFWAPANVNPAVGKVEYLSRDKAVVLSSSVSYVKIEHLKLEGAKVYAFHLPYNGTGITVKNCEVSNSFTGLIGYSNTGFAVQNNYFHDLWELGLKLDYASSLDVSYNVFQNIATIPGIVASDWTYMGVSVGSKTDPASGFNVHHNILEHIGYIGLAINGSGVAEYNIIKDPVQMLSDGGAVSWDHTAYNQLLTIRNNLLINVLGNTESTAPDFHHSTAMGHALYYGNHSPANTIVEGNTVKNASGACVLVDTSKIPDATGTIVATMNQVVRNNKLFNCEKGIILTDQSIYYNNGVPGNCDPRSNSPCFVPQLDKHVTGNEIYLTSANASGLYNHYVYSNGQGAVADFGTSNNNKIFHPLNPSRAFVKRYDNGLSPVWNGTASSEHTLTLSQWQQNMGEDLNSTTNSGVSSLAPAASRGRMIYNDTFVPKTFSTTNGTLESCLFKLDGTAVGSMIILAPLESMILEKGTGTGCN